MTPPAEFYLLLNNDIRLDSDTIEACRQVLGVERVGVVAPALFNEGGLQSGAGSLSPLFGKPTIRDLPAADAADVSWVTGAVMFIKAECSAEVAFDVSYFLVYEDVDFYYRARRTGWRVILLSSSTPQHRGNGTTSGGRVYRYYAIRNRIWFQRKHGRHVRTALVCLWIAGVLVPRVFVADVVKGRGQVASRLALHGLVDGVRALPPPDGSLPGEPRTERWSSSR